MSAPDYETIYDFEGAIETAVKTLLTNNSITAYRQRDASEVSTPFAAVKFSGVAATGHMAKLPNGDMRPDQFAGQLEILTETNRSQNDADHTTVRAKIRNLIYKFQETLTKTLLPYHAIYESMETSSISGVDSENNVDITTINFRLSFAIRSDAWPA